MNSLVGFTAVTNIPPNNLACATSAQDKALAHFTHLNQTSIKIGCTTLTVWGHNNLKDCLHYLPDGGLLALIGTPVGNVSWSAIETQIEKINRPKELKLPWDGRFILLKISPDGHHWTLWNDWVGTIPVFHAHLHQGRIASTLEPITVAGVQLTAENIHLAALISLLLHGYYFSDWTLYKDMKMIPPDCAAEWDQQGFRFEQYFTVLPSKERGEHGWDDLVDEMYHLSRQAIADVFKTSSNWVVPLSGGIDSRLIAAVGADMGVNIRTYTFGEATSPDTIHAQQIAQALGFPWKPVTMSLDYLLKYTTPWANMFGSAMHFHGMHQMQFLDILKSEPPGPIASGFLGEALTGYDTKFMVNFHANQDRYQLSPDGYIHWSIPTIKKLLKIPIDTALEELAAEIKKTLHAVPGPLFHQLRFSVLWSRQRHFTYFSSTLADYWRGATTPFLNRAYARFCYSLPRVLLDDRRLQLDMMQRYYRKLATISGTYVLPGTYDRGPLTFTGSYLVKKRLSKKLPASLLAGPLKEFSPSKTAMEITSLHTTGKQAMWPIYQAQERLDEWLNFDMVNSIYQKAMSGSSTVPVRQLQSLQAFAYRLLNH